MGIDIEDNATNTVDVRPDYIELPKREDGKGRIYRLVYDDKKRSYSICYDRDEFNLPPTLYGDVVLYTSLVKKNFHDLSLKTGCLFLGNPGSGKTIQAYHICNTMLELGYDVLFIYGLVFNKQTVEFLNKTTFQGVIFMDEFGKLCSGNGLMSSLLTTMSDELYHRLWIITENQSWTLPPDIDGRPGRFLFKKEFDRVTDKMIDECCDDYGAAKGFAEELKMRNRSCRVFTLDHLMNVVQTHIKFPELTLDEMTEMFSFTNLRLKLKVTGLSLYYKTKLIGSNTNDTPLFLSCNNTDNWFITELNYKVIKGISMGTTDLYLDITGKLTDEMLEGIVNGTYTMDQSSQKGNDDTGANRDLPSFLQPNSNVGGNTLTLPTALKNVFATMLGDSSLFRTNRFLLTANDIILKDDEGVLVFNIDKDIVFEFKYDAITGR